MSVILQNDTDSIIDEQLLDSVVKNVLKHEKIDNDFEVDILITDGETVRELNNKFRNINSTTDVLSFPLIDFEHENILEGQKLSLGDIVLNIERVISQAQEYGHSFEREICFLTAHSMLHLLGYDHMTKEEETEMFSRQEEILSKMGITR